MTEEIRRACRLAIDAGYRNIDIDSSTLVDLSKPNVDEEQRENYARAAELTALIRTLEADGVTVSVGGEIGEVGNAELDRRRAARVPRRLSTRARRAARRARRGSRKVSVQTGTSHGGVPLPDGGVGRGQARLRGAPRARRRRPGEYGLAGAVQHGASTLPDELFHRFPAVETAEIHLATGFQNALYEHPAFPASLHRKIEAWCFANAADERKPGQTDQQFVYTTRKKAIGPFKRQLWELDDEGRDPGRPATQDRLTCSRELGVDDSRAMVDRYVHPVELHRPLPDALREAVAARPDRPRRRNRAAEAVRSAKSSLTAANAVLSSRAGSALGSRESASIVPKRSVRHSRGQSRAELGAEVGGGIVAGPGQRPGRRGARRRAPALARHQARAEADARVPVELRDRVQLHQRLDRVVRQLRRRHRAGRAGLLLVVADRHRRPAARRPRLRRAGQPLPGRRVDLPVVEAPVEPDARLVHRLVLLLGPGRDGHRGRGHRRVRDRRHPRPDGGRRRFLDSARPDRHHDDVHVHLAR